MTTTEAKRIVDDMLLVCQKLRSITDEQFEFQLGDIIDEHRHTGMTSAEYVEYIKEDMYPWLYGKRNVMPMLMDLSMGVKPITGQTVLNLMVIAHRLCPSIAVMAPMRLPEGRDLPEPDIHWCVGELEPV